MTDTYIRALEDEGLGLPEIGGKGQSLARLVTAGLPVPHGFHITTAAYDTFVAEHHLRDRIAAELDRADAETPDDAARSIAALFTDRTVPRQIATAVLAAYRPAGFATGCGALICDR